MNHLYNTHHQPLLHFAHSTHHALWNKNVVVFPTKATNPCLVPAHKYRTLQPSLTNQLTN